MAIVGIWLAFILPIGSGRPQHQTLAANKSTLQQPLIATIAESTVDDSGSVDANGAFFSYTGSWQHVVNHFDGRTNGTSSRSIKVGATATIRFVGNRFSVLAIKGPTGGRASVRVDGLPRGILNFFDQKAVVKGTVYLSSCLPLRLHTIQITVAPSPANYPKRRYVNLDGATYTRGACT